MKRCWDPDPNNRPDTNKICKLIELFHRSYTTKYRKYAEIKQQFEEAEKYRISNLLIKSQKVNSTVTHPQAIYTSRLFNISVISEGLGMAI
ncbi:unnamed protein product [Rhizophagus irregularis]|nr:unnamed protein product [Rhizophagus irregularis]